MLCCPLALHRSCDDPPFIVLTETKFSFRCIPVWDRYSPHRTRVEKKSTCDNALTMTAPVPWSLPYSLGELNGVLSLLPVNPSQCSLVQVINTDVTYFLYCRSCPCDRHDLYLPSIPASLQTLGRGECVAASAPAPHGLRIISPLTSYLNFLGAIWTFDKKI